MIIKNTIQQSITEAFQKIWKNKELEQFELSEIEIEHPQDLIHGDYSSNICLKVSKLLKMSPFAIGEILLSYIDKSQYNKVELVKPGFINFYLSNTFFEQEIKNILTEKSNYGNSDFGKNRKVLVEHTAINPNKAMHVGHIRNSILGDSIASIFKKVGYQVKIENYLDDTGVQVADIVTALEFLDHPYKESDYPKFDHFCCDLYSYIQKQYEENDELKEKRVLVQKQMEKGEGEFYEKSVEIVNRILKDQLETLSKFSIYYDFLFSESIVLQSTLWEDTLNSLKKDNHLVLETEGTNKGCWTLKDLDLPNKENMINPDKVLVTSVGNVTYTAKDIAHHLWKFGLVSEIPFIDLLKQKNNQSLYLSSKNGEPKEAFYKFKESYAVVDKSQAYNFDVIKAVFKKINHTEQEKNLHHVAYGLVALSKDTVSALGFDVTDNKNSYKMSGRKGIGVKVDDLVDLMVKKVEEASNKSTHSGDDEVETIEPIKIAVGAIKAYMYKFNIKNDIVFDTNEALQITGDSGPYLQYTHARIKGILRKALVYFSEENINVELLKTEEEQTLLKYLYRFNEEIELSAHQVNPGIIYNYLIVLCQHFNSFYNKCQILKEQDDIKVSRLVLITAVAQVIKNGLEILGIEAPEKM